MFYLSKKSHVLDMFYVVYLEMCVVVILLLKCRYSTTTYNNNNRTLVFDSLLLETVSMHFVNKPVGVVCVCMCVSDDEDDCE